MAKKTATTAVKTATTKPEAEVAEAPAMNLAEVAVVRDILTAVATRLAEANATAFAEKVTVLIEKIEKLLDKDVTAKTKKIDKLKKLLEASGLTLADLG